MSFNFTIDNPHAHKIAKERKIQFTNEVEELLERAAAVLTRQIGVPTTPEDVVLQIIKENVRAFLLAHRSESEDEGPEVRDALQAPEDGRKRRGRRAGNATGRGKESSDDASGGEESVGSPSPFGHRPENVAA
jgi:hypothetical protein